MRSQPKQRIFLAGRCTLDTPASSTSRSRPDIYCDIPEYRYLDGFEELQESYDPQGQALADFPGENSHSTFDGDLSGQLNLDPYPDIPTTKFLTPLPLDHGAVAQFSSRGLDRPSSLSTNSSGALSSATAMDELPTSSDSTLQVVLYNPIKAQKMSGAMRKQPAKPQTKKRARASALRSDVLKTDTVSQTYIIHGHLFLFVDLLISYQEPRLKEMPTARLSVP